jgi:dienelactone hydrolase
MAAYFSPGGLGSPPDVEKKLEKVVEEVKKEGKATKFATVGYCWGAKVSLVRCTDRRQVTDCE